MLLCRDMSYWRGISFKAVFLGFAVGYFLPWAIVKTLLYLLLIFGVTELLGALPLFAVVYMAVMAPYFAGYIGARHSTTLPIINGILATATGLIAMYLSAGMIAPFVYPVIVTIALLLGYTGARRYVAQG